jgi:hypothetical protein
MARLLESISKYGDQDCYWPEVTAPKPPAPLIIRRAFVAEEKEMVVTAPAPLMIRKQESFMSTDFESPKRRRPSSCAKKSVTFAPEAKEEDGPSEKRHLYETVVTKCIVRAFCPDRMTRFIKDRFGLEYVATCAALEPMVKDLVDRLTNHAQFETFLCKQLKDIDLFNDKKVSYMSRPIKKARKNLVEKITRASQGVIIVAEGNHYKKAQVYTLPDIERLLMLLREIIKRGVDA